VDCSITEQYPNDTVNTDRQKGMKVKKRVFASHFENDFSFSVMKTCIGVNPIKEI